MTNNDNAMAVWLQGIAEPNRLMIVRALAKGAKNVTDLATELKSEIVNVSHHLGVMRTAGLVQSKKDGRFVIYWLDNATTTAVAVILKHEKSGMALEIPLFDPK